MGCDMGDVPYEGSEVLLSISEVAGLLGIAPSALRYYERNGLIKPRRSRWSNYRGYNYEDLLVLTDIVHFRNAGIAVKELPELLDSPAVRALDELEAEMDKKLDELEELRLALSAATHLAGRIRRYLSLRVSLGDGYQLGESPKFKKLVRFDLLDRTQLGEYLRRRNELCYVTLFDDPDRPEEFVDCARSSSTSVKSDDSMVWQAEKGARYARFLLTTDYGQTGANDLASWRERLAGDGLSIGRVVAEYLSFDVEPDSGRRIDRYEAWAELL